MLEAVQGMSVSVGSGVGLGEELAVIGLGMGLGEGLAAMWAARAAAFLAKRAFLAKQARSRSDSVSIDSGKGVGLGGSGALVGFRVVGIGVVGMGGGVIAVGALGEVGV